ncbi:MAG TPA: proton-conducting transporter membrane subunit, partial [Armatimonadota bacterium]|nr:proton-conducting transporter membrane subunit [Armatimonadota bacterium]
MTDTLLSLAILIPLCPLLAFFAIVFFGRKLPRQGAGVALGAMVVAFTLMLLVNGAWLSRLAQQNAVPFEKSLLWLRLGAAPGLQNVSLSAGYLVDSATAVLLFVVTAVGSLIFWFAMGYMEGDPWYPRFFAYMSLFAAAMLGVVISNSLLWFFICWEIMGLCSYLLIGYWYDKPSAMRAAKKAFVVTRVGDVGFFIGILTLYLTT